MKNQIQSLKGMRDFYPESMAIRNWLYSKIREVSESFGYQEFEGPYLESIELYAAKSGEELVNKQSFVFPDRSGEMITLRPELTPTLARMVAQRQHQLHYPLRWWSFGPFWRYERPQKGRTREFFQWNIDLIGVDTPEADAELIAVAATFFQKVGLSPNDISILVNDRGLVNAKFDNIDIPSGLRPEVLRLIDRREKMRSKEWLSYAQEMGLTTLQVDGLNQLLGDDDLWHESETMRRLFSAIEALGVSSYVRYAPYIIRGLDYYTGTVFEAWDHDGEFRAILGGGRYDDLVSDVGGDPLPGVGFAMGDVVTGLVLKKFNCYPADISEASTQVMVTVFDEQSLLQSYQLAAQLRAAGLQAISYPDAIKLGKQFKYANRIGVGVMVIIGPEEQERDQVSIKDMRTGDQQNIPREDVVVHIRQMLDSHISS